MATITCWRQPGAGGTSGIMNKFDEAALIPTYDLFYYWSITLTLVVCRDTS